jgi:hypothetical protein
MKWIARLLVATSLLGLAETARATSPPPEPAAPDVKGGPSVQNDSELPDTTTGDRFRVEAGGDSIGATVGNTGRPGRQGVIGPVSTSANGAPRCTHSPATYGEYPNVVDANSGEIPDPASQVSRDNNGRAETGWVRSCPNGGGTDPFYWAPAAIDPVDLVPDALADARSRLPAPIPAINPDAAAGGIVNLGMWLAVDDPGITTARAALAGVWAEVTATATGIVIDFGNGDTTTCEGLGTPIPDSALDDLEQGPCGYTYRRSSPDDDPYRLTITTTYAINWTTSAGTNGTLTPIDRSTTIGYDVDEIQTIGISN